MFKITSNADFLKYSLYYKRLIEKKLDSITINRKPKIVYEPILYILSGGGKRVRALLVLLSCEAVGGDIKKAINAAAAIELLHNFTLIHDDVMDDADVRRGRITIHKKWDDDAAILAGDEMIALAYSTLLKTNTSRPKQLLNIFTEAVIQVCDGQGYDKEFETRKHVGFDEYMKMIDKKTAKIISASCEIGALIGGGTGIQISALKNYGEYLGRAFQIQDDLLDIAGSEKEFGKKIGGDIREGKKTFLLIKALEKADRRDLKLLKSILNHRSNNNRTIYSVRRVYEKLGVLNEARKEIDNNTNKAKNSISKLKQSRAKEMLIWLSKILLERTS